MAATATRTAAASLIIQAMAPKQDGDDGGWTTIDHPTSSNDNDEDASGVPVNSQDQPRALQPPPSGDGISSSKATSEACDENLVDGVVVRDLDDLNLMSNLESRFFEGDKAMYAALADAEESAVKVRIVSVVPPNYKIAMPSGDIIDVPFDHPGLFSLEEYESRQLQQEVGMLDIVSSELYGGNGGGPFSDLVDSSAAKSRRITEIAIRSGSIIDGVGATYSDGTTSFYGGDGGGLHRLVLKKGEHITEVTVRYGKLVTELTFVTNTGRSLSRGGPGSIILGGLNSSVVTVKAPGRFYALCALSGRFGKYLDAIQFHWGPIVAGSDVQRHNKDIVTNLASRQHLKTTELYGNEEIGTRFDDGHFNIKCTEVSVVSLCGGPVRGLTARYYTGREVVHGGNMSKIPNKTECASLILSKDEYISETKVTYSGDAVVALTFTTNENKKLGPCGVASGEEEVKESIVKAPENYRLIGFRGTSGEKRIHSIGFNWSPVPKGH